MKKLLFCCLLFLSMISCNSIKWVPEGKHLLAKNKVFVDSVKTNNLEDYLLIKPNSKTFGLPLSLYLYNFGNPNKPKTPLEWGKKNPKSYNIVKKIFSEKQSIAYAKTFINLNKWFLRKGQAPVITDKLKINNTLENLRTYYTTLGYFKSTAKAIIDTISEKKASVNYYLTKGKPLMLDTIFNNIKSPVLDSLYKNSTKKSYLKTGNQYNENNFIAEAARITKLFRNNGIYYFTDSSIGFYNIDSASTNYKTNVYLEIANRSIEKNGVITRTKPYEVQKIRNVNVYTDYSIYNKEERFKDTISYNGIKFFAHSKIKYNPKYLSQSIFLKPGSVYKDTLRNLTRNHLKSLKNFKITNIRFNPVDDKNQLDMNVYLTPLEKYSLGTEAELTYSNIRNLGISGKFSITNRNVFKGAEIGKLSFVSSFFNTSKDFRKSTGFFNAFEIGTDASLEIPRFVAPFGFNKIVPKRMSPRTLFSLGTSFQKNIGLDRQTFTALVDYKWHFNPRKTIQIELLNAQYVKNLNIKEYFNIYNSEYEKLVIIDKINTKYNLNASSEIEFVKNVYGDLAFKQSNPEEYKVVANILNRYNIITSDFLIPVIAYSFTYNNQQNFKDNNFSFFKARVANSGNIMGWLSKGLNANSKKTIFNIPVAQYFKTDIEYKKFWDTGKNSVFGFRTFLGAIYPYGKSDIPFIKSYFAGGSNDIRAWQTYNLGPGKTNSGLEYNIGSLKFLTSAEYRFDIFGSLKGALFVDAGNIWDISNSSFLDDKAKFKGFSSLKDIAIGSGFGIRYDFNFLVLRLDLGFKTYEPYLPKNKWFKNFGFSKTVYNVGINYPF